jgi:hypothetical protein
VNEFLKTLHLGRAGQRSLNSSMVEGIPEFGGYSVPEEYGAFLMDKSLETEIIIKVFTIPDKRLYSSMADIISFTILFLIMP